MFEFDFQVDHDIFEAWADAVEQSPQTTRVFIEGTILGDIRQKVKAVNLYPPPVKYPIDWTTPKQKGYYFKFIAKYDKDGNIIPYKRRGTFFDKVVVELDPIDLNLNITNPNPVARYVIGDQQQRFHRNTGWRNPTENYLEILVMAQDDIINAWFDIIDWKSLA